MPLAIIELRGADYTMNQILLCSIVALMIQCSLCLPLDSFYPFGVNESDLIVSSTTGLASFLLSEDFIFHNEARRILYVS